MISLFQIVLKIMILNKHIKKILLIENYKKKKLENNKKREVKITTNTTLDNEIRIRYKVLFYFFHFILPKNLEKLFYPKD